MFANTGCGLKQTPDEEPAFDGEQVELEGSAEETALDSIGIEEANDEQASVREREAEQEVKPAKPAKAKVSSGKKRACSAKHNILITCQATVRLRLFIPSEQLWRGYSGHSWMVW